MDTELTVKQIQREIVRCNGGCRVDLWIPNVSWGFFNTHEADLIQVTKSGYMTEYEIKRSYSDFLADFKKHTNHFENKVLRLYYVVPESIGDKCLEFLKNHEWVSPYGNIIGKVPCGLITYNESGFMNYRLYATDLNKFTGRNMNEYKIFLEEKFKLASLGCMRFWSDKNEER